MAAYLKYIQLLKGGFNALELIHVPREQNAKADLLVKLASSGKGGRQRTVIQETLKAPRKFVEDNRVDVLQICTTRGRPRSHRSLTQDTLKMPRISTYADMSKKGRQMQVCVLAEGDTWMTPYKRYLTDGALPVEPEEGIKVKIHSGGRSVVQARFHSPYLNVCKWRRVYQNNDGAPRRHLREPRRGKGISLQSDTRMFFLANGKRGLRATRPALQAMPKAR